MSKYSVSRGNNNWSGGEQIIPLSWQSAREWAEEHLDGDQYETIFGAVEEDDSRETVTYSLSKSAAEKARREASKVGVSASAYIETLITKAKQ